MQNTKTDEINTNPTLEHTNILEYETETPLEITDEFKYEIRWLDKNKNDWEIARDYIYCPNCESTGKKIIKNGTSLTQKQKFKCKVCNKQFTGSIHSIIKRYDYYELFSKEYMKKSNEYYELDIGASWDYLSTREGDKNLKNLIDRQFQGMIKDKQDFDTFIYLLVKNAYYDMREKRSKDHYSINC